jgi:hypothetical protein
VSTFVIHNSDLSVRYEEKGLPTGTIWDNRDFGMRSSKASSSSNRDSNSSRGGSGRSLLGDKPHDALLLKDLQKQIRQVRVYVYIYIYSVCLIVLNSVSVFM